MEYVQQHTAIPIPKIYSVHPNGDRVDMVLEFIAGESLRAAWSDMSAKNRQTIIKELGGYIEQLRSLTPSKKGVVGDTSFGSGYDHRLGGSRFGPFQNIADFHTFVRREVRLDIWPYPEVRRVHGNSQSYATKFSHADLGPLNIIVRRQPAAGGVEANWTIAAIIDWEFGGWFPEYWEYTKIHYGCHTQLPEFYENVDRAFTTYPDELAAECAIWNDFSSLHYDHPRPIPGI
ncbi:MAG: hypothetical protein M1825_002365 [Sarcosagium campestre]|nr:MAG: hypothetical protein M1825_002365 [Sarcosagium campestre]